MIFGGRDESIFGKLVTYFENDDWKFTRNEERGFLLMRVRGDNGNWQCVARAREEQDQFMFLSVMDTKVPEEKRPAIAEFITRANYGIVMGNFEMDYDDGEVRYKTSIDVENDRLTDALIRNVVVINILMMDKYLPGIMKVIYGDTPPHEAIAMVEGH